jgi:hypothetical protein
MTDQEVLTHVLTFHRERGLRGLAASVDNMTPETVRRVHVFHDRKHRVLVHPKDKYPHTHHPTTGRPKFK